MDEVHSQFAYLTRNECEEKSMENKKDKQSSQLRPSEQSENPTSLNNNKLPSNTIKDSIAFGNLEAAA